jgi:hypothetical protein
MLTTNASGFNPNHPTFTRQINPIGDRLRAAIAGVEPGAKDILNVGATSTSSAHDQ